MFGGELGDLALEPLGVIGDAVDHEKTLYEALVNENVHMRVCIHAQSVGFFDGNPHLLLFFQLPN